ncbi:DUF4382 domain-containing protein [Candidatus Woesearchaeota archaeon]|nr:DUF4382 domain-containing protein [Candidatus Woesearchaeota archaeon]
MTLLVLVVLVAGCTAGVQAPVGDAEVNATGRAVFVITDAAANMGSVSSVKVTVDSVSVHSASEGWVAVLSTPGTYDLLQLKAEGKNALLADVQLEEGRYEQARLQISKVVVTDAEGSREAKLPSGELKVVGNLEVDANTTSTATFEFIADESLHVTGSGEYVMAPVVKVETRHDADVEVRSGSDVVVSGGSVTASSKVGMDISGNVGVGLKIGLNETLDIENGKIKIGIGMPVSVAGKGRLVVGVTDKAVKASSVSSVMVTVDNVSVHNSAKGWVDVSLTPRTNSEDI